MTDLSRPAGGIRYGGWKALLLLAAPGFRIPPNPKSSPPARNSFDQERLLRSLLRELLGRMIVLFGVLATIFYLRDYFLLRMGPARKIPGRVLLYLGATLVALTVSRWATMQWVVAYSTTESALWSVVIPALIVHIVICGICVWIERTERHRWAWILSIIPVPVLWWGFALAALPTYRSTVLRPMEPSVWLIPVVLSALIARAVLGRRREPMDVQDLDFALDLSVWSNLAVVWALPIAL